MINSVKKFKLDSNLQNDSFFIKDLKLSQFRLFNNANYPWFLLIPRVNDVSEIYQLNSADQKILIDEISYISKILSKIYNSDKMNIASLGNFVKQLHFHVIVRYKNDRVFPNPVWLDSECDKYDDFQKNKAVDKINEILSENRF